MTRVAIWSLGEHARRNLLPAAASAEEVSLAGVFSRNRDIVAAVCAQYGCRTWDTLHSMLEDDDVDAVFIAGPNGVHFEQCRLALEAGKHVWCEKSLTPDLAETEELLALAQSRKLVLAEAFMFAHHPQFRALRDLLQGPELGRTASIRCSFGFPHLAPGNIRYSRSLAGGALLDAGAYCVAAALMLMDRDPERVLGSSSAAPGFEVDTDGSVLMYFADNTHVLGDWGFGRCYRNEIEIWGDSGYAVARRAFSKPPELDTVIEIVRGNERRTIEIKGGSNHFSRMMGTFASASSDEALREELASQALRQARAMASIRRIF